MIIRFNIYIPGQFGFARYKLLISTEMYADRVTESGCAWVCVCVCVCVVCKHANVCVCFFYSRPKCVQE